MGDPTLPPPSMLIVAAFSRHGDALDWAKQRAAERWGMPVLESERFAFRETEYYRRTMGEDLQKVFWAFVPGFDPAELADVKLMTNTWEVEFTHQSEAAEERPLNIDPGYLNLGKLILASTKDFTHRIYLARGIFAEVTLYYQRGRWEHHRWTFPDYRRDDYQAFFSECRQYLHRWIRGVAES
ncbi:MAG: DUF4416 family protein [Planctomycetaceae bacterium]|nr:DUF4416 family protein [Planctomycetaceae bacterium]